MADPVTLAMVGAAAGAALKPNDPLKGAMLGATVGFTGGTALGVGAAGTAAAGTAGTAAATGGTAAATGTAAGTSAMAAQPALSYAGGNIANAANMANTTNAANLAAMNSAGMSFAGMPSNAVNAANTANTANTIGSVNATNSGLSFAGMSPSTVNTAPSFMDKLGMAGKSAYAHPGESLAALNATQGLLSPEQIASAPAVPIQARGQLRPFDPIALLDPYKPSVIGSQQSNQFSLI
jgi:pilus assembly protein FimV